MRTDAAKAFDRDNTISVFAAVRAATPGTTTSADAGSRCCVGQGENLKPEPAAQAAKQERAGANDDRR